MTLDLARSFASDAEFLEAFDGEVRRGALLVPVAGAEGASLFDECAVELRVPGAHRPLRVEGYVSDVQPAAITVLLPSVPPDLEELAVRLRRTRFAAARAEVERAAARAEAERAAARAEADHDAIGARAEAEIREAARRAAAAAGPRIAHPGAVHAPSATDLVSPPSGRRLAPPVTRARLAPDRESPVAPPDSGRSRISLEDLELPPVASTIDVDPSLDRGAPSVGSLPVEVSEDKTPSRPPTTVAALIDTLSPTQKMRLALSGSREERLQLLRDTNKIIHIYVLKNPRITLEEVQYAARQPALSPDALKFIADHLEWGANPQVCAHLVRNPKTPMDVALRSIDRVGVSDLRQIARGAGRGPLVQAARKLLTEGKGSSGY